jgi:hypothetical protein
MKTDGLIRPGGDLTAVKLVEKHLGASGIPPSKSRRAKQRVAAVADGCLGVSSADILQVAEYLEERADEFRGKERLHKKRNEILECVEYYWGAKTVDHCAKILRRHAAATSKRQPPDNIDSRT